MQIVRSIQAKDARIAVALAVFIVLAPYGATRAAGQNDERPHLVIIMAEGEYKTEETLPKFAEGYLSETFQVSHVFANPEDRNDLPGIEVLDEADVVLISVRRRVLPAAQMAVIRKFVEGGKPVVGIRTASHAFVLREEAPPEGLVAWEEFDRDVMGGNYSDHHGDGPDVQVTLAESAAGHPILAGLVIEELRSRGSLYAVSPLGKSATPLLIGTIPGKEPEPVAWTNRTKYGGRAFYMSIAHPDDFASPSINRLLSNAVHWAAELPIDD